VLEQVGEMSGNKRDKKSPKERLLLLEMKPVGTYYEATSIAEKGLFF